ncbi:MAG: dolichyl-phosphate beta-glucosyltransferase [Terriglobales bacterium]
MSCPTYSIVIPAYNESGRIGASLEKVLAHIAERAWNAEVVVVNDGSRDDTAAIVRRYAETTPHLRLIENPGNRGKGYSVRNGMLHARGEILIFSDADLSSPIYETDKLIAALRGGADVAIGSRWMRPELQTERQPLYRQLFGRIFNLLLRVLLGLKFKDTQCGLKAFTRSAAQQIFPRQRIERWGFDPELLFLARKQRLQVAEVPVEWAHDERSKINPLSDGFKMFMEILRIRWYALTGKYAHPALAWVEEQKVSL